jgi:uncharacterized protein (DUF2147 family)
MKNLYILIALSALLSFTLSTDKMQYAEGDVLGNWLNADKDAHIRIFKAVNGKYAGKIEWMKEPNDANGNPKKDPNNPNPKLRDRDRMGMAIMMNFQYNSKSTKWEGGTIYDPKSGKTYDGYMYFENNNLNTLHLRGYVMGMSWIGKTSEWTRVK